MIMLRYDFVVFESFIYFRLEVEVVHGGIPKNLYTFLPLCAGPPDATAPEPALGVRWHQEEAGGAGV